MMDEIDESRAVAELTAASIIDKLYPELVNMIANSLISELESEKIKRIQDYLKENTKQFLPKEDGKEEKTTLEYLEEIILQNPNANRDLTFIIFR